MRLEKDWTPLLRELQKAELEHRTSMESELHQLGVFQARLTELRATHTAENPSAVSEFEARHSQLLLAHYGTDSIGIVRGFLQALRILRE